ncbi:hypothetical protein ACQ4PT_066202 [Festuca glaucescens]
MLEKSHSKVQHEQVRVCAEIGIECTNFNPAKRPDTEHIISRLDEAESLDKYVETGKITSQEMGALIQKVKKVAIFKCGIIEEESRTHVLSGAIVYVVGTKKSYYMNAQYKWHYIIPLF